MGKMKSNIIYNLLYQMLILALPLISAPYLSRVLGVAGVGTYSYVYSIAYYFYIAIVSGLTNYGNRSIAKVRDKKDRLSKCFWSIYCMQLTMGLLIALAYIVYVCCYIEDTYKLYFVAFIPYVISAISDISWLYFGLLDFKFTTVRSTIVKLLSIFAIFVFVKDSGDLLWYFLIIAATYFLSNALLWTQLSKYIDFYKPTAGEVLAHVKPNMILFVPILAISVYRVMDKIMIKELASITELGYYDNADKIITVALAVFSAVATVMMPSVSHMVEQEEDDKIKALLRDTMQISMFLAFGMLFGLVAVGPTFAPIFYGEEFKETGIIIQLLAITVVLSGWKAILRSQFLIPYEKDKSYVISLVIGAVVNLVINCIFIPIYKARGAVIGTILAELTGFIIQTAIASHEMDVIRMFKDGCIFILPGAIMTGAVVAFLNSVTPSITSLCCAILIGIGIYCLLGIAVLLLYDKNRLMYYVKKYFVR